MPIRVFDSPKPSVMAAFQLGYDPALALMKIEIADACSSGRAGGGRFTS
jgi:hypothetical protein